jgi:GntR family transcriptional regulator
MTQSYAFPPSRLGSSNTSSFVPLYVQLADQISRLLREQGEKAVGKALPSEAECAEVFGVSRPTVRQAMGRLLAHGLIKREKGRGTFVTRPRLAHDISHDFDDEMRTAERRVSYTLLEWGPAEPSPEVSRVFDRAIASDLRFLRRLRAVDGEIVGIEERFVPARIADAIDVKQLEAQSIFELMRKLEVDPVDHIEVEVSGRLADRATAKLLRADVGAPLLLRVSTFRNAAGMPLVHGTMSFLAEHYAFRFTVNFSRAGTGPKVNSLRTKNRTKRSP